MIEVGVRHRFAAFTLDVAFETPSGVTTLFGPSGSGKTTVVNAVAGLLRPDEGRIVVEGEVLFDRARGIDVPVPARRVGYVFQDARLFPHLTVRGNLGFGRWFRGGALREVERVVEMLGLGGLLARRPGALSGGERQRVAIGRALLSSPRILLLDEPLAALDEARKAEILPWLERLRDEAGMPILHVTHSLAEAARLTTTLVVIADGRVQRAGPLGEVLAGAPVPGLPEAEAGGILSARVLTPAGADGLAELEAAGARLFLPLPGARVGEAVRLRLRSSDLILSLTRPEGLSALNILPARVVAVVPVDAARVRVALVACGVPLAASLTRRSAVELGLREGLDCHVIVKSVALARD